jgi:hypothetical protein
MFVMAQIGTQKQSPSSWASTISILHERKEHIKETMRFSITKKEELGGYKVYMNSSAGDTFRSG